ncbi:hypothetical protein [uncultured Duncaniella sp.]|uniref:hypothetical protein n=1 Tax=uncultured Duncaniella sp. TaxID=2768039 RepID=UPI0027347C97|nr:hypothetical protein [uncultured Duncaniella sp.]
MENLNRLSEIAHQNAVEHGFWTDKPSAEHCLMLVVTEIAEMVEADRAGKIAVINHIRKQNNLAAAQKRRLTDDVDSAPDFIAAFDEMVKNTVEDEMADVVIRLLDLAGSFGLDFDKLTPNKYHRAFDRFSFAENAFALTKGLCRENINIFKRIQFGIHYVSGWAKCQGINLDWHVRAKMRFNANRPVRHGKKY